MGLLPWVRRHPCSGSARPRAAEPKQGLPILVVIELTGGNDGLNTVVPYADDLYAKARPTLRIEPKSVLKLDDRVGLNPALKDLHKLWEAGDLAVVQGAGYPNPNRSHFRSMEIWQTGERRPRARCRLAWPARRHSSLARPVLRGERGDSAGRARPQVFHSVDRQPIRLPDPAGDDGSSRSHSADRRARPRDRAPDSRPLSHAPGSWKPSPGASQADAGSLEERLATIRVLIEHDPGLRVFYTDHPDGLSTPMRRRSSLIASCCGSVSRSVASS